MERSRIQLGDTPATQGQQDCESEECPSIQCLEEGLFGMRILREDGFVPQFSDGEDSDSSRTLTVEYVSSEMSEGEPEIEGDGRTEVIWPDVISREQKYLCDRCGSRFGSKREIAEHMKLHFGNQVFTCGPLPSGHGDKQQGHNVSVRRGTGRDIRQDSFPGSSEGPIPCCVCGDSINSRKDYTGHLVKHCSGNPKTCIVCKRVFQFPVNLRIHLLLHTGEKPQVCHICNRSFRLKTTLNQHIMTHTGEKPHTCASCGKCFRHKGTLNKHNDFHSKVKRFKCIKCGKLYKWKASLHTHSLSHE